MKSEDWMPEALYPAVQTYYHVDRLLYDEKTTHQHLVIFENAVFGRIMMLDGITQLTTRDEFIYHEMMAHMPLVALAAAGLNDGDDGSDGRDGHDKQNAGLDVLVVGGGDGGTMREVLKHPGVRRAVLCEIDASVIEMAKRFFPEVCAGVFDDPKLELVIDDGVAYVGRAAQDFDAILIDSTDPVGPGAVLFSPEFYAACQRALKPGGVLVTQNGVPFLQGDELRQSMRAFGRSFADYSCYLATTPTYVGGPMAYGWASERPDLRRQPAPLVERAAQHLQDQTKYYNADIHMAAFALPGYVRELVPER